MLIPCMRWPVRLAGALLAIGLATTAVVAQTQRETQRETQGEEPFNAEALRLSEQGRYAEAITVLKRLIADKEANSGLDDPVGVAMLDGLGQLYYKLGLYGEAIPIYERALAISDKTLKVDNPITAQLLRNLATVYQLQKRYAEAERIYARSITQSEKLLPATRLQVATSLNNLATLYQETGRLKEAEPLLQRVLNTYRESMPAGHPWISTAYNNLGQLYEAHGDYAKAEAMMKAALRNIEISLDREHPQRGRMLQSLGQLYVSKQDWPKAAETLREVLDIYQKQAQRGVLSQEGELSGLPNTDLMRHREAVGTFAFSALAVALATKDVARRDALVDEVLEVVQRMPSAASASLTQMSVRRMKGDGSLARLVRLRQDLVVERQAHDKRFLDQLMKGGAAVAKEGSADAARVKEIDRRIGGIDRSLLRDFPDYAALTNPQPLALAEVQSLLRYDEALVTFIETSPSMPVAIMALSRTQQQTSLVLLRSDALEELVAALRCGLDALDWVDPRGWPAGTPAEAERKRLQQERFQRCRRLFPGYVAGNPLPFHLKRAHALYHNLFNGVASTIAGKHLLIVPSPSLMQLPFNTLVTEMPPVDLPREAEGYRGVKWLGTQQAITILPSIVSLAALRRNVQATKASKPWIGFGNPLLDGLPGDRQQSELAGEARARQTCGIGPARVRLATPGSRAGIGSLFQRGLADVGVLRQQTPLPETADELCEVAERVGATDADVWLGVRATETQLKRLSAQGRLADYATLHFATHGVVAGEAAAILKAGAEPALLLTPPAQASEEDDGLLTASEVAQLKLDADWVVLSACNTAAGGAEGAEALSGLARAFFYAGARALLVSHWEVESDAAVALTTQAFAEAQKDLRMGRAEALRRSMLALSTDPTQARNAHPSVWAPFVLVGEGQR